MSETVTYWAELWRPMEKNSHGETLVSPAFLTQGGAVEWIRARREAFDQVGMWKRVSREKGDFEDVPLHTDEAPLPDPDRLHALVGDLKKMLDVKRRDLDKPGLGKGRSALWRPEKTMDARTRSLSYDEVYDEHGKPRFEFGEDGWPVQQ